MKKESIRVRQMQPGDIAAAIKLSSAEGWNQTEKDWKFLFENIQNICLVAETGNKVIGTITASNYSFEVAWIGMVLVDKEFRGRGVSKALLITILEKLKSCKSIKLDATSAGQAVYQKFQFEEEYSITRFTNSLRDLSIEEFNIEPERIQVQDIPEIVAFDSLIFGANRMQLIEFLIREYPDKAWMIKQNNRLEGFALGREGNKYHHIGPVMASSTIGAKSLIQKALSKLINQAVVVDVLNDKKDLITWLNSMGFIEQRQFVRMYRKGNPLPGIITNYHLICGPEFG